MLSKLNPWHTATTAGAAFSKQFDTALSVTFCLEVLKEFCFGHKVNSHPRMSLNIFSLVDEQTEWPFYSGGLWGPQKFLSRKYKFQDGF